MKSFRKQFRIEAQICTQRGTEIGARLQAAEARLLVSLQGKRLGGLVVKTSFSDVCPLLPVMSLDRRRAQMTCGVYQSTRGAIVEGGVYD